MTSKEMVIALAKKGYIIIPPKVAEDGYQRKERKFANSIVFGLIVRAMDERLVSTMSSNTAAKFLNRSAKVVNGYINGFILKGWIKKKVLEGPYGSYKEMTISEDLFV